MLGASNRGAESRAGELNLWPECLSAPGPSCFLCLGLSSLLLVQRWIGSALRPTSKYSHTTISSFVFELVQGSR